MSTEDGRDDQQGSGGEHERPLRGWEKRLLALLGAPTFAFALSITVVTTYMPVLAESFAGGTVVIGVIIASEGLAALTVPLVVGPLSDQLETRIGGRLPFMLVGAPVMGTALVIVGFVRSVWLMALVVFVFFAAYYVAYEPYRALYPDALQSAVAGRGQSSQAVFRGLGTGAALVIGGLLFSLGEQVPFIVYGVLAVGVMAEFLWGMTQSGLYSTDSREDRSARQTVSEVVGMLRERPALRAYLVANALWELAIGALKTFIVLFLTIGVGLSMLESVAGLAYAAVFILLGSAVSGKLGDRFGKARVMTWGLAVFGVTLLVPLITQKTWVVIPIVPFIALSGGIVMSQPYAVLMPLMPEDRHGLLTGFYSATRGFGIMLGPILAGGAIAVLRDDLSSTNGYAAMWLVCGGAVLTSLPYMRWLRAAERRKRRAAADEEPGTGRARGREQPSTA